MVPILRISLSLLAIPEGFLYPVLAHTSLRGGFVDSTDPIVMCAARDQSQRLKEAEIEAGALATHLWSSGSRSDQKGNTN
jgi:hypothetical protein